MKVILQRTVENLGDPGDVISVKGGYARNYLFPKGLAVAATKGATRHVESLQNSYGAKVAKMKGSADEAAAALTGTTVTVQAKAAEDGKLFGSVTPADVAAAVSALVGEGFTLDKRSVLLSEPIKSVGEHAVTVKLHPEVEAQITVEVVGT